MNDLSTQPPVAGTPVPPITAPSDVVAPVVSTGNKEIVGGRLSGQENLTDATGQELNIPKEVSAIGVKVRPTVIPIPPAVSKLGVKPAGTNIPVATASTVVLPISDTQIAQGLNEGISNSLRWLSEWCIRRLKQLHFAVKSVHGQLIRSKT